MKVITVSTFSSISQLSRSPAPFLQVTRIVVLLPFLYSYRQTLRRTISHPVGATATHGTDLEFILKCLSHRPPFQRVRGEVETERRGCGGALQCR